MHNCNDLSIYGSGARENAGNATIITFEQLYFKMFNRRLNRSSNFIPNRLRFPQPYCYRVLYNL